jgi:hypothetical protein
MEIDDDPVTDAMRAVIDGDTDEQVVYPRSVRALYLQNTSVIDSFST